MTTKKILTPNDAPPELPTGNALWDALNELAWLACNITRTKGFHGPTGTEKPDLATMLINIHGEVSELWEAHRRGTLNQQCDKATCEPLTSEEEELADILIRTLDLAEFRSIDIGRAVRVKMAYNVGRAHMHGKQC